MRDFRFILALAQISVLSAEKPPMSTFIVGGWQPVAPSEVTKMMAPMFQDYLNEVVGKQYDPPMNFVFQPMDMDLSSSSRVKIMEDKLHMLYGVPGHIACKAAEFSWVPFATPRVIIGTSTAGCDALVIFSLLNNTAIRKIEDLKGKKLGCGYLYSGTTYLHGNQQMLEHGLHIFRDMAQVRFYGPDYESLHQAVMRGDLDGGFATSSWITKTHLKDMDAFRIHDRQDAAMFENEVYPSPVSRLTPTYGVIISNKISWQLKAKILDALEALNVSHPAMKLMKFAGWRSSVNFEISYKAAELAGVAYKTEAGSIRCRDPYNRMDIWMSIKCPSDHYKVDYNETLLQCARAGVPCPAGVICFCKPCVMKPQNIFMWEIVVALCAALYGVGLFYLLMRPIQNSRCVAGRAREPDAAAASAAAAAAAAARGGGAWGEDEDGGAAPRQRGLVAKRVDK